ncbi:MAG: RNA-binding protein, partial [Clostridia bacterium]|nr:RNA-binding protein [Clostridia bacterium]
YVNCSVAYLEDISCEPSFEEITGTVASLRADSVVSVMLKTSRSKAAEYIESQRFFLNQVLCTKCDKEIKENDILTVRHHGKAILYNISGKSKKGRIFITVKKYM